MLAILFMHLYKLCWRFMIDVNDRQQTPRPMFGDGIKYICRLYCWFIIDVNDRQQWRCAPAVPPPASTMAAMPPPAPPLLPSSGDDFIYGEEDRRENDMWDPPNIL